MKQKKSLIFAIILLILFSGCQSTNNNNNYYPSHSHKGPLGANSRPDMSKAYFYGEFGDKFNALIDRAILFKNHDQNRTINFKIQQGSEFRLYEVEPGEYSNDFGYYIWDMFYWNQNGIYQVRPDFKKNFTAKAGEIYYIGSFSSTGFTFNFNKHIKNLLDNFIYFRDLSINLAYNQKN